MASLPVLSGREVVKTFESLGWKVARQSSSPIDTRPINAVATARRLV